MDRRRLESGGWVGGWDAVGKKAMPSRTAGCVWRSAKSHLMVLQRVPEGPTPGLLVNAAESRHYAPPGNQC